jgi:D-3-phosphoglycerate dehydrogenase
MDDIKKPDQSTSPNSSIALSTSATAAAATPTINAANVDDDAKEQRRILVADKLGAFVIEALRKKFDVMVDPTLNGDPLKNKLQTFQPSILVVRSTKVTKAHLEISTNLALIIRAGAGTNTIAVDDASNLGIFVANCPGKNGIAVAELAMGHLINLDRRIADNVATLRKGQWNKKGFAKAKGLKGRTLAIIGVGNIGREVCKRALAFDMIVRGFDPFLTTDAASQIGIIHCATVKEAVTNADALTVHLPHNSHTHYIINKDNLSLLKDGAYVINTSRGGVVNEQDMLLMIKEKNLRYAPDVYENEPKSSDKVYNNKDIYSNPNIYGTHHIGASTAQAEDAVGSEVLRLINIFTTSGKVENCINLAQHTPAKYSLSIRHKDVVGVLAGVLNVLKIDDICVHDMNNIVFRGAKSAVAVLQIDQMPSDYAISKIRKDANIYGVKVSLL